MTTTGLYILYAFLAVGAAGVYLGLPAGRRAGHPARWAARILTVAALAALAVFWTRWVGPAFQGRVFVTIFAIIAVLAAVRVVSHPRPIYSALYFVLVVLAVTGLCILAAAEFLGIALVIVYGGAILVTYVFVIMLARQREETPYDKLAREPLAAVTMGFVIAAAATQAMVSANPILASDETCRLTCVLPAQPVVNGDDTGNVRAMGQTLMTTYIMAVEVAGVLLLVAMVGAVALARKRIDPEDLTPEESAILRKPPEALNRRGREAVPF